MSSEHDREVLSWRERRIARLTARDGWLSLIGKSFLEPGVPQPVGSTADGVLLPADRAPAQVGVFELRSGRVWFTPIAREGLRVQRASSRDAQPLTGAIELKSDALGAPDRLLYGEDLVMDVMERADTFAVRLRDLKRAHPDFAGIDYFPIDPSWRVVATLEPYVPEKQIDLLYDGGVEQPYFSPGAVRFERDGVEYRLDPVFESDRKRLWLVFGDPSNRDQTYGAGRFLYAPLPEDGSVVLDFNCAFNPPCAFSPFVACPLPPFQNRLKLPILAGEKRPREAH
jgi:uncharacterized protein